MNYTNFDLTVGTFERDFFISATLPGQGTVLGRFVLPFRREEMVEWQHGLNEKLAQEIGSVLYESVFKNEMRFALQDALRVAARNKESLRLRLNLDAQANRLPWELLFQRATRQFLALDDHLSIVRQPTILEPLEPLLVNFPLRLLVITAQARDAEGLDIEAEKSILRSAALDLSPGQIVLDLLEQPSLEQLRQQLQAQTYHILHFIGHGRFRPDAGEGEIQLVYPSGHGQWVTAAQLARIVRSERALRVVFLNACDSAQSGADNAFSGVAAELVRTGDVSAAVAMQFPITDRASLAFTRGFYQALLQASGLDAAVTQGRLAIDADVNHFEWATPALYLHAADGELIARAEPSGALRREPLRSVTRLYGRDADLKRYRSALEARNFVIIEGMAGIGKTSVGATLAQEQRAQGRRVYWITFDAVSKTGGEVFLWEIADLLRQYGERELWDLIQQPEAASQQPIARFNVLLQALQSGAYTLCFDDLHLVQDDPIIQQLFVQIQKLFRGEPEKIPARFIIMTRDVPGYMQYLERVVLDSISIADTREWLAAEGLTLAPEQLARLDRKVQGNPQFLQLALSAGLAHPAGGLRAADDFINALEAQRDVRDYLLDRMYAQLSEPEKRALDVLCIFDAFVPINAVQAVAASEEVRSIALVVDELVRKNVAQEKRENGDVGMHALVRDWCYRNLDTDIKQRLHQKAGAWFEKGHDYIAAAYHLRQAEAPVRAAEILTVHIQELLRGGNLIGLVRELDALEDAALPPQLASAVYGARGDAYDRRGPQTTAVAAYRRALALNSLPVVRASLLERLGLSLQGIGEYKEAMQALGDAVTLARENHEPGILIRSLLRLGRLAQLRGDLRTGVAYYNEAIELAQAEKDDALVAEAKLGRGRLATEQGEPELAQTLLTQALEAFHAQGNAEREALATFDLGLVYHHWDRYAQALEYYERALPQFEFLHETFNLCAVYNNLADIAKEQGDLDRAKEYLKRAVAYAAERGDPRLESDIQLTLAETLVAGGAFDEAAQVASNALDIASAHSYELNSAALHRVLGQAAASQGQAAIGRMHFEQALELMETRHQSDDMPEMLSLYSAYSAFLLQHEPTVEPGCEYLHRALVIARRLGAANDIETLSRKIQLHCPAPNNFKEESHEFRPAD